MPALISAIEISDDGRNGRVYRLIAGMAARLLRTEDASLR